jgi:hypothetical protein
VDVDVLLAEKVRIDTVPLRIRSRPGQRRGHRLLHDLAQVPGHRELFPSAHPAGFDEHDVSAHRRPHQAHSHPRCLDALLDFFLRPELRHAQIFADDIRCNLHLV